MADFNKKVAKEIAQNSFAHVIDCIYGVSDSGYDLDNKGEDFEQNFEEDLAELKITVTERRLEMIGEQYDKLVADAKKSLDKLIKKKEPKVKK